jgi:hypothetical protein
MEREMLDRPRFLGRSNVLAVLGVVVFAAPAGAQKANPEGTPDG